MKEKLHNNYRFMALVGWFSISLSDITYLKEHGVTFLNVSFLVIAILCLVFLGVSASLERRERITLERKARIEAREFWWEQDELK